MAIASKTQKIIIGITAATIIMGVNISHSKISSFLLLLGIFSGSTYLVFAPKPWIKAANRKQKYQLKIHQLREARKLIQASETMAEMTKKIAQMEKDNDLLSSNKSKLEKDCEELYKLATEIKIKAKEKADEKYQMTLAELEKEKQQLTSEVVQLQNLAEAIATNTERDARIEAAKIKQAAEQQALQIIEATKSNLQNTVFEPEKNIHLITLANIEEKRLSAIAELERITTLQEKTRTAIEKMKVKAQEEYTSIKKNILEQAKKQYLNDVEKFNQVIEELQNQLNLLITENQMLRSEIEAGDEPQYPEGYREHEVYARGIIDFYKGLGIKLDYKLSFREGDRIVVRFIPRDEKVGEQQLRKFHDRLMRKFDLSQLPNIVTTAGTIQFDLRLIELQNPVIELLPVNSQANNAQYSTAINPQQIHPELITNSEMRSHLENAMQREFIPPSSRFSPFAELTQTEREWAIWLYRHCKITDQNTILFTVWQNTRGKGVSQGIGQSYIKARAKLHRIFDEAGIPRRRNNDDVKQ